MVQEKNVFRVLFNVLLAISAMEVELNVFQILNSVIQDMLGISQSLVAFQWYQQDFWKK